MIQNNTVTLRGARSTTDTLDELRGAIATVSAAELPAIIGAVETIKAEAFARLVDNRRDVTAGAAQVDDSVEDRLLTAEDVAARLQESSRWVRDHADQLGRVRLGGRKLRFSEKKLNAIIRKRSIG